MLETILVNAGITSAVISFGFALLNRKLAKRQEEAEQKEEARRKNEAIVIEGVMAAITLGEATAKAATVTCTPHLSMLQRSKTNIGISFGSRAWMHCTNLEGGKLWIRNGGKRQG